MQKEYIVTLYDYNYWANDRILDTSELLKPEQLRLPVNLSFGSLMGTFVHILGTEWMWRMRAQDGISPKSLLKEQDFADLAALRTYWKQEQQSMRSFLAWLDSSDLDRPVHYTNTKGQEFATPLWEVLAHVVNHGTQFRSEAGVALSQLGRSPGDVDFIYYVRLPINQAERQRAEGTKAPPGSNPEG